MGWHNAPLKSGGYFRGGYGPHLIHGSLDPYESAPNGISISSVVFAQLTRVTNTQTSVAIKCVRTSDAA